MRDAAIGNGAQVLDSSATGKAGNRSGKKDADAKAGGFENALGRARTGDRLASQQQRLDMRLEARGAEPDAPMLPDESMAEIELPDIGQEATEPAPAHAAAKPVIDIRAALARAGAAKTDTADGDLLPHSKTDADKAYTDKRDTGKAERLTVADKASDGVSALRLDDAGDTKGIKWLQDDIRLRDAEKTVKLRKDGERAVVAEQKKAAAVAADRKADKGKDADQPVSVNTDALSLLQNAPVTAPQAGAAARDPDQAQPEGPRQAVTEKQEPLAAAQLLAPLVAPQMQAAMPVKTEMPGKAAEPVLDAKMASALHGEDGAAGTDASEARPMPEARGGEDRIFRFSRADGRGQTLDMRIGAAERNDSPRSLPVENVTVLDSRRYLALSPNMGTIATTLSGDPEWTGAMQPGAALSNAATQASTGKVVNTLKIQIHPMTLGAVTATMRLAGDELTIDLQVETAAAYRQLNDDQRSLVESLRAQGFSVDQVTVTLVSAPDKADTAGMQGNGQQNAATGQQSAQDGGASARRDDRHASGQQQNQRRGEEPQNGDPAAAGGRPGHLYL